MNDRGAIYGSEVVDRSSEVMSTMSAEQDEEIPYAWSRLILSGTSDLRHGTGRSLTTMHAPNHSR